MSRPLDSKIALIRRKEIGVEVGKGIALIIAILIAGFAITAAFDWMMELPIIIRATLLLAQLAALAWIAWNFFLDPILFGPDDDEIALRVERGDNRFRGRLISSIQLSRQEEIVSGTSPMLVRALIVQTESMAAAVDFGRFVPTIALLRAAIIAIVVVLLGAGSYLWGRPASDDLIRRAVLMNVPVPRKTHVVDMTSDVKVARGDSVTISARAVGVLPTAGRLIVDYPSTRLEYEMRPTGSGAGADMFSCKIDNVQQSFTYRIWLNDGHGDDHAVTAVSRPDVDQLVCVPRYPAYTSLSDMPAKTADLSMIVGSGLDLIVIPDKNLSLTDSGNQIEFVGGNRDCPLRILPAGSQPALAQLHNAAAAMASLSHLDPQSPPGQTYIKTIEQKYADRTIAIGGTGAEVPLPAGTRGFAIHLVDEDGFATRDPVVHPINLLPTHPPRIQIVNRDQTEELVTRTAHVNVAYQAVDDFALSRLSLRYKAAGGQTGEINLPLPQPPARVVSDTFDWDLTTIPFDALPRDIIPEDHSQPQGDAANAAPAATAEQNVIEFWLHVENANNVTSANKQFDEAQSELHQLHVVTPEEKEKDLQSKVGRIPGQIDPMVQEQTEVSNQIGNLVLHGGAPTTQP